MAVIRDVMPAFELFQPASVEAALELLDRYGSSAWVLAGGLDSFDWLKDRIKRPERRRRSQRDRGAQRNSANRRRPRDRRDDDADRGRAASGHSAALQHPVESRGGRGVAANPESGDHRRQCLAGHALLVLSRGLVVLSGRRQHLLRGHADRNQPRARDPRRRSLRGREPFRHLAGTDRTPGGDGHSKPRRRARRRRPRNTSSVPASTSLA